MLRAIFVYVPRLNVVDLLSCTVSRQRQSPGTINWVALVKGWAHSHFVRIRPEIESADGLPLPAPSSVLSVSNKRRTCALRLSSSFRLALLCTVELSSTEPAQIYKIDRWFASKSLSNILSSSLSTVRVFTKVQRYVRGWVGGGQQFSFTGAAAYIHLTRPTWLAFAHFALYLQLQRSWWWWWKGSI